MDTVAVDGVIAMDATFPPPGPVELPPQESSAARTTRDGRTANERGFVMVRRTPVWSGAGDEAPSPRPTSYPSSNRMKSRYITRKHLRRMSPYSDQSEQGHRMATTAGPHSPPAPKAASRTGQLL